MLLGLINQLSYRKRGAHIVGIVLPIKSLNHMTSRSYPPGSHRGHALTRFLAHNKFTLVTRHASRSMTQYPTCSQLFSALQKKKTSHLHLHSAILDHFHIWRHQLNHATPATKNGPPKNTARQAVRLAALSPLRVMLGPSGGLGAWMPWCHGAMVKLSGDIHPAKV